MELLKPDAIVKTASVEPEEGNMLTSLSKLKPNTKYIVKIRTVMSGVHSKPATIEATTGNTSVLDVNFTNDYRF